MGRALDYLKGYVTVEIKTHRPERFANLCTRCGVEFWDLERENEDTARAKMHHAGFRQLMKNEPERAGLEIRRCGVFGSPVVVSRVRGRYVLLAALLLCCVGIWVLSGYIWRIEVSGNEEITDTEILRCLESVGVHIGAKTDSVDAYKVRNQVLLKMEDLIWITVNMSGSTARVEVAERRLKPEIEDVSIPTRVVAAKDGVITDIRVLSGISAAGKGDTVAKGDVLIDSRLVTPRDESRYVHAAGEIYARTWYTLKAQMPLECTEKFYTGGEKTKTTVIFGKQGINLYLNSGIPFDKCDKIIRIEEWDILGIMALPISVMTETYREFQAVQSSVSTETAKDILKNSLTAELESMLCDGEVQAMDIEYQEKNGVMTATMYAQCFEQIGETVEAEPLLEEETPGKE